MFIDGKIFQRKKSENTNGRTGNWRRFDQRHCLKVVSAVLGIAGKYQRRTQKGMGRTEKTGHNGAAKNPRLVKACNITK
jgi:hypothetical protein